MRRRDPEPPADPLVVSALAEAAALVARAAVDRSTATAIPFLWLSRSDRPTELRAGVLPSSVCFVLQGAKTFHLGDRVSSYGAGSYLASTFDLPAAGRVAVASRAEPYLGARLEIAPEEVAAVVVDARIEVKEAGDALGSSFIGRLDVDVLGALVRLLRLLDRPRDAAFLAPALKREIVYRLLTGPSGHAFHGNVMIDRRALDVRKAVAWLQKNFDQPMSVEALARASHMSVSSLHHKFKSATTMGPLQYQKRLRLEEARRRLLRGADDASSAAFAVGYESTSQFSREYRRLFGLPPSKDARRPPEERGDGEL